MALRNYILGQEIGQTQTFSHLPLLLGFVLEEITQGRFLEWQAQLHASDGHELCLARLHGAETKPAFGSFRRFLASFGAFLAVGFMRFL